MLPQDLQSETGAARARLHSSTALSAVLGITALVFAATISFQFAYDDQGFIVENSLVHSWRYVPLYFRGHVWQYLFPDAPANYYRPLNLLWLRLNDALFGLQPAGWHVLAIVLHLIATVLVFYVVGRLADRPLVPMLTALLFGIHPMRHEVVAWVSGTTESLWAILFFLAFLAYLNSCQRDRVKWMTISCLGYAAALLAKETAIMLPAVVVAHAWLYDDSPFDGAKEAAAIRLRRAGFLALAYAPVAVVYLAVRTRVLQGFSHPQVDVSLRAFLFTLPSVLFFYLKQWMLPIRMSEFYDFPLVYGWDFGHVVLPILGLFAATGLLLFFRRKLGGRQVAFAACWMFLTLLPALDFAVFPPGELGHDRYFYVPSLGAALLCVLALEKLAYGPITFGLPRQLLLATLILVLPLSYCTATASGYWMNDYVLFSHAHGIAPENVTVRNNYAIELARRGDMAQAMPLLSSLLNDHPDNWLANYNFARLSYQEGNMVVARRYFERAQKIDPKMPDSYLQLGLIDLREGRVTEAEVSMRRAIALRPDVAMFHFALGVTLTRPGTCGAARAELAEALTLQPGFPNAQQEMDRCPDKTAEVNPDPAADAKSAVGRPR